MFLAARRDSVDAERVRADLLSMRRKAYNDELGIQAAHVGCPGAVGRLGNGAILSQLNADSERDAASIINTYNYFLGLEIIRVYEVNPRGNRYYYAKAIREWQPTYWQHKDPLITVTTENSARAMALQDFYRLNGGALGTAKLEPRSAVCPVCLGWIARGIVPLRVALNDPPPYHPNCPHRFDTRPDKVAKDECPNLWMGE
jgi:hypothetical protein